MGDQSWREGTPSSDPGADPFGGASAHGSRGGARPNGPRRAALPPPRLGPTIGWTFLGTIVPGSGLIHGGRRVIGMVALLLSLALVAGGVYLAFPGRKLALGWAVNPTALTVLAVILAALALAWVLVIGATYLAVRPRNARTWQKVAGAAFAGLLSLVVIAPLGMAAQYSVRTAQLLTNVFEDDPTSPGGSQTAAVDPWANKDRLNILVMGGDTGENRDPRMGIRADTVMVASIDTHNGATTLFSLPRQTARIPFPADSILHDLYPNGFFDGVSGGNDDFFLNAMYNNIPPQLKEGALGAKVKNVGAEVMKIGVGEALGLGKLDYYVIFTMDGFKDFINAIGGVTLNVNYRIPIGGKTDLGVPPDGYIEPGPNQHMDGRKALWYARGRYGLNDYKRLERQRCVINAVTEQTTPDVVLTNFNKIAAAGEANILTDVPRNMLPAMVELALKVKDTKLHSVVFKPGVANWVSANPPWPTVRAYVRKAIKETEADASGKSTSTSAPTSATPTTTTAKPTASASASPSSDSESLNDACAYHPESGG